MLYLDSEDEILINNKLYYGESSIVILVNKDNKVLLNLRDDKIDIAHPNCWSLPGGKKELFETSEETALREVKEEIDFFINDDLILFCQTIDRNGSKELISVFSTTIDKEIFELTLNEGADMEFFNISEIEQLNIVPYIKKILLKFFTLHNI